MNPFFRAELPHLEGALGGQLPSLDRPYVFSPDTAAFPLDATLGQPGTPQSGTGQAALLTGADSATLFGRHFGPWIPVALRPLVEEKSFLKLAVDDGADVAFANAYPRDWPGPRGSRAIAGPPLAARGAGLLTRTEEALATGDAVSSGLTNDGWRTVLGHDDVPDIGLEDAGRTLGRIAGRHDLTLFAHYDTDTAGHAQESGRGVDALERVDRFLGGILETIGQSSILIVSDHGNIEDVRTGHTRNPALGVLWHPEVPQAPIDDLRAVPTLVASLLPSAEH